MVFVTLPFTDQRTRKRRPAVVVSSERYHQERPDLIILAVTSQVRAAPAVGEAAIGKWKGPGSSSRPFASRCLRRSRRGSSGLVLRKLGRLEDEDRRALRGMLGEILGQ